VRYIEVVEDGISGGNVIPNEYNPSFAPGTPAQFEQIRGNIVKANILGRLVAKDWSGAMVWADIIPESKDRKVDYQAIARQLEAIRAKHENGNISIHIIGFAKMVGDISDGARSVMKFFVFTIAFTWLLLFLYSSSVKLASLTGAGGAGVGGVDAGHAAADGLRHRPDEHADAVPDLRDRGQPRRADDQPLPRRDLLRRPGGRHGRGAARARVGRVGPLEAAKFSFHALFVPGSVAPAGLAASASAPSGSSRSR
jgi:hypothetical protein